MMSFRQLLAAVMAVTVLFAPAVGRAAEAYAAAPNHHAQMMQAGHCEPAADGDEDAAMSCCVAMCVAVATAAPAAPGSGPLPSSKEPRSRASLLVALPPEIATPPPRAT